MHLKVAHLEAGLRSFNRRMPEEHNRVLTDHAADLLLAPTQVAMDHLANEGLAARSVLVGDVMTDVCYQTRDAQAGRPPSVPAGVDGTEPYLVATIHRAENTDDPVRLRAIITALQSLPAPVVLLTHPRLVARASAYGLDLSGGSLHPTTPLPYPAMVATIVASAGVVTDSGGLQKEAFLLQVPCMTLRTETEWTETLADGWNVLDPDLTHLPDVALRSRPETPQAQPYGDGQAAVAVVEALRSHR
jgi:UDP-N-acetylglucosamine 2-epimerase (non-hydrolysing)